MNYAEHIRVIEGFPSPDISFKDISTLIAKPEVFKAAIKDMAKIVNEWGCDYVAGPESRGFVIGVPVAVEAGKGFIMARKPGKLPGKTISKSFTLEYAKATLELPEFTIQPGKKYVLVDDLMATGGTIAALKELIEECGGIVTGILTLIELEDLNGRAALKGTPYASLVKYPH